MPVKAKKKVWAIWEPSGIIWGPDSVGGSGNRRKRDVVPGWVGLEIQGKFKLRAGATALPIDHFRRSESNSLQRSESNSLHGWPS